MLRALVLSILVFAGCATDSSGADGSLCPDNPSIGSACGEPADMTCSYEMSTVCSCSAGEIVSCTTCGDLLSCNPGAFCTYTDWERDCDCSCGTDGAWHCTPFYGNYGCPFGMP